MSRNRIFGAKKLLDTKSLVDILTLRYFVFFIFHIFILFIFFHACFLSIPL
jgi:hypothetical protein